MEAQLEAADGGSFEDAFDLNLHLLPACLPARLIACRPARPPAWSMVLPACLVHGSAGHVPHGVAAVQAE